MDTKESWSLFYTWLRKYLSERVKRKVWKNCSTIIDCTSAAQSLFDLCQMTCSRGTPPLALKWHNLLGYVKEDKRTWPLPESGLMGTKHVRKNNHFQFLCIYALTSTHAWVQLSWEPYLVCKSCRAKENIIIVIFCYYLAALVLNLNLKTMIMFRH